MSRRVVAGTLVITVQVAALVAPFVHAHPDDHETDHHAAHAIHAHFSGHGPASHVADHDGAVIDDDDGHDRAVFLQTFLGEAAAAIHLAPAIPESFEIAAPEERRTQQALHVAHGHDPPALRLLPARAPPFLPVLI